MPVDSTLTLGAAYLAGLKPHARCLRGKRSWLPKFQPCDHAADLDLESLIWTRGAAFPCWKLAGRLKCPRCGEIDVDVTWSRHPPNRADCLAPPQLRQIRS